MCKPDYITPLKRRETVLGDVLTLYASNRGFPKVDHSGIDARIVLEQINSVKKNYL